MTASLAISLQGRQITGALAMRQCNIRLGAIKRWVVGSVLKRLVLLATAACPLCMLRRSASCVVMSVTLPDQFLLNPVMADAERGVTAVGPAMRARVATALEGGSMPVG